MMRNCLAIARRELKSSFSTPIAYVAISGFMFLAGFFFFSLLQHFSISVQKAVFLSETQMNLNDWVVVPFYQTLEIILIFLVPILAMRSLAEEKRSGTFELLMTCPIKVEEVVVGKFLGLAVVSFIMLLSALVFPLGLVIFAEPEVPPVLVGFVGLVIFAWSMLALALTFSSLFRSQTAAGVLAMVFLLVLYVIDAPVSRVGGAYSSFIKYLAPGTHSDLLFRGVVQSSDLVYFLTLIALGLFAANRVLEARRWR